MSTNTVPNLAGGGEPPYDKDMDRRLIVLETRFDTILPTLATKSDLEALRAEVQVGFGSLRGDFQSEMEKLRADVFKAINDSMRWTLGVVVSLIISVLAVNVALFNALLNRLPSNQPTAMDLRQNPPVMPSHIVIPPKKSQGVGGLSEDRRRLEIALTAVVPA